MKQTQYALVFATMCLPALALAQADVFDPNYKAPRTPYGQPDLQGIWSNAVLTPLERPEDLADKPTLTPEEAAAYRQKRLDATNRDRRTEASSDILDAYNDFWWDSGNDINLTRRTSLIIDPPNGRLPALTPAARERLAALRSPPVPAGPEDVGLGVRCMFFSHAGPPMLPGSYNNNYQIVQSEDYVLIINEMGHETRMIPLDGRESLTPHIRQWRGSSRGHWDGETLVVTTTNRSGEVSIRGSGPNMVLTERFKRVAPDVVLYEFTVNDPESFTQPWTVQVTSTPADGLLYEVACHEGNRSMEGILGGARAAERAAAGQQ